MGNAAALGSVSAVLIARSRVRALILARGKTRVGRWCNLSSHFVRPPTSRHTTKRRRFAWTISVISGCMMEASVYVFASRVLWWHKSRLRRDCSSDLGWQIGAHCVSKERIRVRVLARMGTRCRTNNQLDWPSSVLW